VERNGVHLFELIMPFTRSAELIADLYIVNIKAFFVLLHFVVFELENSSLATDEFVLFYSK
jgi:hypothetical protein